MFIDVLQIKDRKDDRYKILKEDLVHVLNGLSIKLEICREMLTGGSDYDDIMNLVYGCYYGAPPSAITAKEYEDSYCNFDRLRSMYIMKVRYIHYLLGNANVGKKVIGDNLTYTGMYTDKIVLDKVCDIHDKVFFKWANGLDKHFSKKIGYKSNLLGILLVDYVDYDLHT